MNVTFQSYSEAAASTQLPTSKSPEYLLLGLVGEAGELANKYKKVLRGDKCMSQSLSDDMAKELGDCLWYVDRLAACFGWSLEEIAMLNNVKLAKRKHNNKLKGDGDER